MNVMYIINVIPFTYQAMCTCVCMGGGSGGLGLGWLEEAVMS